MRRLVLSALILAGVVLSPMRATPLRAAGKTTVTFYLNWITNVEFAGLWVAQAKGWWAQAGLTLSAKPYDFNNDPTVLVGAGKYEFGFQDGASMIIGRAQGIPVKAIWCPDQISPFAFITMPNSGITTVKQFRGKRIGYQAHQRYVLETMLNHEGMTLADVKPVVVGFDPTLLVAGKVDAYLAFITNEPIDLALTKHLKVNIIPASKYGYNFYNDVLFTTDNMIKTNPALVRKVVSIVDRGWKWAIAHPTETARIVDPRWDNQDPLQQQIDEMHALIPLTSAPGAPVGTMVAPHWQQDIALLLKYHQISHSIPASSVFTTQFLPK
jgi:NitT/TauT family transport system substrate-binding protein